MLSAGLSGAGAADLSCAVAATPVTRQARRLLIAIRPRDVHLMGRTLLSAGFCDLDPPSATIRPRDTPATNAPFRSPFVSGLLDHVGCHASRSMRPRIRRKNAGVKWLSANWR